ncbi:hypothetical protein [Amycolatopsis nigrescens]|uniref:hypothetical protein n=1 Tax=Amycolatopsis nigrescens TaxID=381445 RepID=UPI00036B7ED8|nr:hypothetical protein [Amycolatopsis nigrescens]
MDEAEHIRQLDKLISRIDLAADRIFEAAKQLSDEVDDAQAREDAEYEDALQVGMRTKWRWRRLDSLDDYADVMTESVVAWTRKASHIYAQRPTSGWGRYRQRRQLLSIANYFEHGADRLGKTHP